MKQMKYVLLAVVALLVVTGCTAPVLQKDYKEKSNVISVSGKSELMVMPDEATVIIRIQTENKDDAQKAQDENREISNNVRSALRKAGVLDKDIETQQYRLEKIQEWDYEKRVNVDKGYRVFNTFKLTITDFDKIGKLIDLAVQAGANGVDSVNFDLSKKKQAELKTEALLYATQNAKEKAQALADGAGIRLGKVVSIMEQTYDYYPLRGIAYGMDMAVSKTESAPTPIDPSEIQVFASVFVEYEIQ